MSFRHRKEAYQELLHRYKTAFDYWWSERERIKVPDLTAQEAEFLPSALALQAAPVSPAGRWVAKILMGLLLTLFVWSLVGKMDIVVNGQGKIIAGGYTKSIASVEVAKVVRLHVEEGQKVKAGDLLIELDSRDPESDHNKAQGDRQLALLQMERSKALLQALATNAEPRLARPNGVDESHYLSESKHLQDLWRDYVARRDHIQSQIKRYTDELPLATRRSNDFAQLAKDHDVSEHAYLEKEQARLELVGQLEEAKTQLGALTTDTRKTAQGDLLMATRAWSGAVQDVSKASAHSERLRIVSPVDGVVQQLTVHTVGGVVPAAQPLMLIVPSQHNVELEAYIENKDIGFVHVGQQVQIKVDTYPYTKYGTVPATVTHVSHDAVDLSGNGTGQLASKDGDSRKESGSSAKGLMYAVKVALENPSILVDGEKKPLTPGMSGSIEIKTGERRIIEYVLSPLMTHAHESLHER